MIIWIAAVTYVVCSVLIGKSVEAKYLAGGLEIFVLDEWVVKIELLINMSTYWPRTPIYWPMDRPVSKHLIIGREQLRDTVPSLLIPDLHQIWGWLVAFFFEFLRVHEALITPFDGFHVLLMEKDGTTTLYSQCQREKGSAQLVLGCKKRSGTENMYWTCSEYPNRSISILNHLPDGLSAW